MDVTARLAATSSEFLHVPFRVRRGAAVGTPTAVKIAVLAGTDNPLPEDWWDAEYVDGAARILIGPEGGTFSLERGDYLVWVRWAAGAESPVEQAPGRLRIY